MLILIRSGKFFPATTDLYFILLADSSSVTALKALEYEVS